MDNGFISANKKSLLLPKFRFCMKTFCIWGVLLCLLWSCARVGSPVGGQKDTIPPRPISMNIDSPYTNVPRDFRVLRIKFDEYITLKDIQKNLIISPPIQQIKRIFPSTLPTKEILIEWKDTLKAHTTYSFNFGNAIQDNNEGNKLPYYHVAFSTGDKLDDLYISGTVREGYHSVKPQGKKEGEAVQVVGLYPHKDTIDHKQKPLYIDRVDDDGYFELNYLSAGKYRIVAFEDKNGNSIPDAGTEDIAFLPQPIEVDKSVSGVKLTLLPSKKAIRYVESKEVPGGALFLFEGKPKTITLKNTTEELQHYQVYHKAHSDSLFVYFDTQKPPFAKNSTQNISFEYDADGKQGKAGIFYRNTHKPELVLSSLSEQAVAPKQGYIIRANYNLSSVDTSQWTLKEDSLIVKPFEVEISPHDASKMIIKAEIEEGKKYTLFVPKGSVKSWYQANEKAYSWDFEGDKLMNYGSLTFRFSGEDIDKKYWIQLIATDGKIVHQVYASGGEYKFPLLKPAEYYARVLIDENGDGLWRESDLASGEVSEKVYLFPKKIVIRPLWELVEDWALRDEVSAEKEDLVPTEILNDEEKL